MFGVYVWLGGHAPRLKSRPERASDMHLQAPNTQTFLPACCLLPTACDYNGLGCFDPLVYCFAYAACSLPVLLGRSARRLGWVTSGLG